VTTIEHGRVRVALHELRSGPGPAVVAVHALHGASAEWGESLASWHGSVYAVDLTGHGSSGALAGGAYYPELLAGDVDVAVAATGARHLVGRGLGAYLALLVAGSRPTRIDGALLLPGEGLDGGGADPVFHDVHARFDEGLRKSAEPSRSANDPALSLLESDVRPRDYAESFARRARRILLAEDGGARPPWWSALRELPGIETVSTELPTALLRLAGSP
jgi:pimeloyl-ACP methyl ester carboxylesterase